MSRKSLEKEAQQDADRLFQWSLREDLGADSLEEGVCATTLALVPEGRSSAAAIVARDAGVVSGLAVCQGCLPRFAPELDLKLEAADGESIEAGQRLAVLSGEARQILVVERTCLNFLCRLSGIASLTREFASRVEGTRAKILDTRKTAPGWRSLEKYAVACGGGTNHRMGLYDAIMIKDNHLAFLRETLEPEQLPIPTAIERARQWISDNATRLPHGEKTHVQLEVDSLVQLKVALPCHPDSVLLDNMTISQLREAVQLRDDLAPAVLLEASGGVTLETVQPIASTGVDRISVGALTHSATNFDIGLDWVA